MDKLSQTELSQLRFRIDENRQLDCAKRTENTTSSPGFQSFFGLVAPFPQRRSQRWEDRHGAVDDCEVTTKMMGP
jgi:hypothetical protein